MNDIYSRLWLTGSIGSFLGRWCIAGWNSILTCGDPIRSDVWPNSPGADFHDSCVRGDMQWRHNRRHRSHTAARHVRNVLRICHFSHLWIRTECHSIGAGLILPNIVVVRRHLANWRNAIYFKVIANTVTSIFPCTSILLSNGDWMLTRNGQYHMIYGYLMTFTCSNLILPIVYLQIYFILFAVNASHNRIAMHADPWLGYHGGRSLSRLRVNVIVDLWLSGNHIACAKIQARLSHECCFHHRIIDPSIHPTDFYLCN